jgi:hypothetical protein
MPDQARGNSDAFDRLTKRVGLIGGLIAALVGLNGMLTSCSRDYAQRYADFRSATNAEEATWRALYKDYLETFDRNVDADDRRRRLLAIDKLSQRDPPRFDEFRLGWLSDDRESKEKAIARIAAMKKGLRAALENPDSSGQEVVRVIAQNQSKQAADTSAVRREEGRTVAPEAQAAALREAAVPPSETPNPKTQTLAAGSANGWDLDLFWCASRDPATEQGNYTIALARGRLLAQSATARRPIGSGVLLGRIRLRVLPTSSQGTLPNGLVYPQAGDGLQLRYEDKAPRNRIELGAARAVQQLVNRAAGPPADLVTAGTPTPWYMSMFVCTGSAPAAAA